jgi:CheY-like chemotaxis protein
MLVLDTLRAPTVRAVLLAQRQSADAQIAEAMRVALGARLVQAADGYEAIDLIRETNPAAIVLDARLPGIDAIGVLFWLRSSQRTHDIPVLALAEPGDGMAHHLIANRCAAVLSPSANAEAVAAALTRLEPNQAALS